MKRMPGLMLLFAFAALAIMGSASCYTHNSAKAPPADELMLSTFVEHPQTVITDVVALEFTTPVPLAASVLQWIDCSPSKVVNKYQLADENGVLQKRRCNTNYQNIQKHYSC